MKRISIAVGLIISFLLPRCKHEIPSGSALIPDQPPRVSATCSADTIYFANTILPLLSSACAVTGCHDAGTHEEGLVLNNYSGILSLVRPGNAGASKLVKVISAGGGEDLMPPPPHPRLTAQEVGAIEKWINQGARNNQCLASCDTAVIGFSQAVLPILNTYCKGCHNPASLGGGIDLSSYSPIKVVALNGRLMGSIKHQAGFAAMPKGGNKLDECQVRQIEKWILSGAPNN